MSAFNVVRFRVKPGREAEFIGAQRISHPDFAGSKRFVMIKTGDRTYCAIGEWDSYQSIVAALTRTRTLMPVIDKLANGTLWPLDASSD